MNPIEMRHPTKITLGEQESFWLRQREISEEYVLARKKKSNLNKVDKLVISYKDHHFYETTVW